MNSDINKEIERLNFEDFLLIVLIILCILNINGDKLEKEYLIYKDIKYRDNANKIFKLTIIISLFIYLYYFNRNYNQYKMVQEDRKNLYQIKVIASIFFIVGTLCLIYFQNNESSFIGTPTL